MAGVDSVRKTLEPVDPQEVDFADPRLYAEYDMSAMWREMRSNCPVYWQAPRGHKPGFWVITTYDAVMAVYQERDAFTSERGNVLTTLLAGGDSASGKMMAVTDGRRHTALRGVLQKALSPRVLSNMSDRIDELTKDVVTEAGSVGECDFARDIAARIPLTVVCDLLEVPAADRPSLLRLTSSALSAQDDSSSTEDELQARNDLLLYFYELVSGRRRDPGDDVISVMINASVDGVSLNTDEIVFNCYSLMLGGNESSRLAMIGGLVALIEHPAQWEALRSGDIEFAIAAEEVLRWTTPTMHFGRTATKHTFVGDEIVASGDIVTLWNVSANRDERAFIDPDMFDISRQPNRHVTFGNGRHFCIGAHLGRMEVQAMLRTLSTAVSNVVMIGPAERIYSNFLSGIASLPVRIRLR